MGLAVAAGLLCWLLACLYQQGEIDYARLLDTAHQQLGGPLVVVLDNLNTHLSRVMAELIAARDWLTVFQLPPNTHELNPVELVCLT